MRYGAPETAHGTVVAPNHTVFGIHYHRLFSIKIISKNVSLFSTGDNAHSASGALIFVDAWFPLNTRPGLPMPYRKWVLGRDLTHFRAPPGEQSDRGTSGSSR